MDSLIPICPLPPPTLQGKRTHDQATQKKGKEFSINQLSSLAEFQKLLDEYVLGNRIEEVTTETTEPVKKKKKKKKKFNENTEHTENPDNSQLNAETQNEPRQRYVIPESTFERVMEKCIEDKQFWSTQAMKYIIDQKMLPRRCYKYLFHCIKLHRAFDLLEECSQNLKNVPEAITMDFVRFLIKKYSEDKDLIEKLSQSLNVMECPISKKVANYLCHLLAFPFHQLRMHEQMNKLSQNEALILLQFLHYILYLISPALYGDTSVNALDVPEKLNEKQVLRWIESLLDGHLISFTMSSTLRPLVQEISKTTKRQIRFYRDIATLAPYLEHLQKAYPLPEADTVGVYKYEQITL